MFRIHAERVLGKDIDTVFEAIADHASYDRISEGYVQVPLLGRMMDQMAERSFSKAFSSLLKAIEQL